MTDHYLVLLLSSGRAHPVIAFVLDGPHGSKGEEIPALASELYELLIIDVIRLAHAIGRVGDCSDGHFLDRPLRAEALDDPEVTDRDRAEVCSRVYFGHSALNSKRRKYLLDSSIVSTG